MHADIVTLMLFLQLSFYTHFNHVQIKFAQVYMVALQLENTWGKMMLGSL